MKNKSLIFISLLAIAALLSACGASPNQNNYPGFRSLNINGTGIAYAQPDIAYVNISVHTESETATTAVNANNTRAQKVLTALTDLGVAAKDLRTTNFSIAALQRIDPNSGQMIGTYYAVDNSIIVTVRDLPKLGSLLDKAIQAGANSISNIQFDVADDSTALKEARAKAMQDALKQAGEMAQAAGFSLGAIQNINYSESIPTFSQYATYSAGKGGGAGIRADAVPVNPGQLTFNVTVSLTYAIK